MAVSAAFPLSLIVKLSRASFPIDIDFFRFFSRLFLFRFCPSFQGDLRHAEDEAAFPLSLVVKLSRVSFLIDIDIFRFFFQTVSVPFFSFLPGGPQTCRGLNRPRLCPKTILYLYFLSLAITFPGSGLGPQ